MPFVKGQSGNPAGRPVGSRNRFTSEMQDALDRNGLLMVQRLLELANDGNSGAMRQCLDRLIGKHRPSAVELPAPDSPNYVMTALTEIHRALGAGEIASDEAGRLVDLVGRTARVLAMKAVAEIDFAERLTRVEQVVVALLKAGTRAAQQATSSEAAPVAAPAGTAAPAIEASAETMAAAPADAAPPVATPAEPGVIDNNNGNTMSEAPTPGDTRPPAGDGTDQTIGSISPPPLAAAA